MRPLWIAAASAALSLTNTGAVASYERPVETLTLKRGGTLLELLTDEGVHTAEAAQVAHAFRPLLDLSSLTPSRQANDSSEHHRSTRHTSAPSIIGGARLGVSSASADILGHAVLSHPESRHRLASAMRSYQKSADARTSARTVRANFVVKSSLYKDGLDAGVPEIVLSEVVRLLQYHLDLQRQVKEGDRYQVLYERKPGKKKLSIISFTMTPVHGQKVSIFRYVDPEGKEGYFYADGKSVERSMLRTPVEAKRITSGFGMRRHPIYGYSRMHKGVDFAAPTGTPVYASGDGVIDYLGRKGGYGRYLRLDHVRGMQTAYAHLSKFAPGLKRGSRVKQGDVIGYVGSSGRSTGPHLHYEVIQDGVQINPLSVAALPSRRLTGLAYAIFRSYQAQVGALISNTDTVPVFALAAGSSRR